MVFSWSRLVIGALLGCLYATPAALAQPQLGQAGKDVIYVPSPLNLVEKALDMAKIGPSDYVIDLGSGDGRVVIAAAKRGARALGVEYTPALVQYAKEMAARAGVAERAQFVQGDLFATDFSQATVVYLFLLPALNLKLMPTILNMKPGTKVLSANFGLGSWQPQRVEEVDGRKMFLWVVPSREESAAILRRELQMNAEARERDARELAQLRREREQRVAQQERERRAREDEEFQAALRENEREDREAARQAREEREARDRQWMDTAQSLMQNAAALKRQQDDQNARREAERARIESDNARYRQMRAEEDRRWLEQNQRQQQALLDRQRAEQEYERQRREQAMAQQREAQAAEQRRQQAEQLRRQQQEQQRAAEEARRRQQLAEDSTPRVESLWRNNVYYLRNNGSRRVMCQVSGMVSRGNGIGPQTGLESFQKAVVLFPGSEEAPFSGPVANPRFFGCRVM